MDISTFLGSLAIIWRFLTGQHGDLKFYFDTSAQSQIILQHKKILIDNVEADNREK